MVRLIFGAVCQDGERDELLKSKWLRWRRKHKLVIQRSLFFASLNLQTCPTFLLLFLLFIFFLLLHWTLSPLEQILWRMELGDRGRGKGVWDGG